MDRPKTTVEMINVLRSSENYLYLQKYVSIAEEQWALREFENDFKFVLLPIKCLNVWQILSLLSLNSLPWI